MAGHHYFSRPADLLAGILRGEVSEINVHDCKL